jgi:membrane fusion protein (multidrug efflux system)
MRSALAVVFLLATLVATGCADHATTAKETAPPPAPVSVVVAPVTTATVERVADVVGSFFANEEVTVASQLESRVVWLGPDMGDHVAAGEVVLKLDDADLQAQLREVRARLVTARADDERGRSLRAAGVLSHQEAERMVSDAAVLAAQRDLLEVKLDRSVIHAPLAGAIATRMVSVGEIVQSGRPLYKIVQDDPLKFRTPIPERFAAFLHLGQEVRVSVAAYGDRRFVGTITRINPTADEANRSILVEAAVPNPEGLIKPGFFGSGDIVYDPRGPALVVPEAALTTFAGVTKVFVVKDGKAEERVVRTGVSVAEQRREIADGVHEGEEVAVTNLGQLENGAAVTVTHGEPVADAIR